MSRHFCCSDPDGILIGRIVGYFQSYGNGKGGGSVGGWEGQRKVAGGEGVMA